MNIEIRNLSKSYKSRTKTTQALRDVNLTIRSGEIVCILGHNGAGKTTLVKSICGLLRPDQGAVYLDGRAVHENLSFAHGRCSAVLEGSRNIYYYLTAYENLRYFGLLNGLGHREIDEKAAHYLRLFALEQFRDVPVNAFSRGMQQKTAIIIALMKDPEALLLDEPTLGLDILSSDAVIEILHQLASAGGRSIIITTHDVHLIERLNARMVFMNQGQVVRDSRLPELKRDGVDRRYQITLQLRPGGPELPADAEVRERQGDMAVFETADCRWLEQVLASEQLIQIEKCSQSVAEIYKAVMSGHA